MSDQSETTTPAYKTDFEKAYDLAIAAGLDVRPIFVEAVGEIQRLRDTLTNIARGMHNV